MKPIIKVQELSKQYHIGKRQAHYETFRDAVAKAFRAPLDRLRRNGRSSNGSIWALKDMSFEVMPGEVVGIVGRNGAGKSTLLKILSRVTEPTSGCVELYGRVGSLLEVGTGFHSELTGRENIYLNGAILGMKRVEIERKFDEIVSFAETEKFLDTPVKHYSSGMYMRLAFAVAAHLEPEILVVDEVLAVGDATFQKKCLGKIGDVARAGRTVLFVSHNMGAVRTLCNKGILIRKGQLIMEGDIEATISTYLSEDNKAGSLVVWDDNQAPSAEAMRFLKAYILNDKGEYASALDLRREFSIVLEYEIFNPIRDLRIGFFMQNLEGINICGSNDPDAWSQPVRGPGRFASRCIFPGYNLNAGTYLVYFAADSPPYFKPLIKTPFCLSFSVEDLAGHGPFGEKLPGVVRPRLEWEVSKL